MALNSAPRERRVIIGDEDIVALGGTLTPESMIAAYSQGIFPWPIDGFPVLPWFCPEDRAVLEFSDLHIPKSLARAARKQDLKFTIDRDLEQVVRTCAAAARPDQGTWITPEMIGVCIELYHQGYAHSVEAWLHTEQGDLLVGGLYGIAVNGFFSGESMFHLRPNASKLALLHLINHLKARGLDWMDIQVLTPHMEQLGAKVIRRRDFLSRLAQTQARGLKLFDSVRS